MKMKKILPIVCAGVIALSGFGCVTKTDVETMEAKNRRQNAEQRKLILQLEEELAKTRAALKAEIDESNDPVRQKTATIWIELNSLRKEFAQLKGNMEVMELRMNRQLGDANATMATLPMKDRVKNIEFALENELNVDLSDTGDPQPELKAESHKDTAVVGTKKEEKQPVPVDADPAKALYDRAYSLYKEGKYEQARSYWAEFNKVFPKHPYVSSSLFWQGQCYYKLKEYGKAALIYDDVITKFPKSPKYRAAIYKQAASFHQLGKTQIAKPLLQELIKNHPDSVEATQAKNLLKKWK